MGWSSVATGQEKELFTDDQDVATRYPRMAKALHLGLVLLVTFQLWNSLAVLWFRNFTWFPLHVLTGLILTAWLVLSWIVYVSTAWGRHLIRTWVSLATLRVGWRELRAFLAGGLPRAGIAPGLSSLGQAVFFFGVNAVTFSGFLAWLVMRGDLPWAGGAQLGLTLMRVGTPILAYLWIGHVAMAVYHALRGDALWRIFLLWKRG